jgi:hypothetical protein
MLSNGTLASLAIALTSDDKANEVADALNKASATWAQASKLIAAVLIAAHTSATTDFAALEAGDILLTIPAVGSVATALFETVVTAGTKPSAAVVGDMYIALRAPAAPTASNVIL